MDISKVYDSNMGVQHMVSIILIVGMKAGAMLLAGASQFDYV